MVEKILAAAVQFRIEPGRVENNLGTVVAALERLKQQQVRLAVLPEMWSTGFDYRSPAHLADQTSKVLDRLAEHSARLGMVVVGSLPEAVDGALCNTTYVLDRGLLLGSYRKLHLFSPMQEDRYFRAGDTSLVVDTSAGRLGVAICYDLRFPELFRRLTADGADIICLSAQWPSPRQDHWRTLLKARAIENQIFMVAANCCGKQGKLEFFGMSLIVSPRGEVLGEGGAEPCEVLAQLDGDAQRAYREAIPAWRDRRPDVYGPLS